MLYADADALDHGVLLVLVGVVTRLETGTEELTERLPEAGSECAQEGFQDAITGLVGLAVDELDEQFALILGHLVHLWLVLLEQFLFKPLEIGLFLLLVLIAACRLSQAQ